MTLDHTHEPPGDFRSLLFPAEPPPLVMQEPDCFHDLNLDQIVERVTVTRKPYDLKPIFYTSLSSVDQIEYRQHVYRDLSGGDVRSTARAFADAMTVHRQQAALLDKLHNQRQRQFWTLEAIRTYHHGVRRFADDLARVELASAGMCGLRDRLHALVTSPDYAAAVEGAEEVRAGLDALRFTMQVDGLRVSVLPGPAQVDYSTQIEEVFARFRQGEVKSHRSEYRHYVELDRVEEGVLELLARLYPRPFAALEDYLQQYQKDYREQLVDDADRGLQFYLGYLDHLEPMQAAGLSFAVPTVNRSIDVAIQDGFDLALASGLTDDHKTVVANSLSMTRQERVVVVTGANQGGKTTFSRAFGQAHWLANLGLAVPGTKARLQLFDRLFTHYEHQEDVVTLRSKLEDELVRVHQILQEATEDSVLVLNEMFGSTTLDDAVALGTAVMRDVLDRGSLAVCVTFIDELSELSEHIVSMVAEVDPHEPARRTFCIRRRPADGMAHALALARKYGLTREQIAGRISA